MRLVSWLRHLVSGASRTPAARRPANTTPIVELLEERAVPTASGHDVLYVSDDVDSSVKAFDAQTGAFLGDTVAPGAGGLLGPRGLIYRNNDEMLVVGQNPNLPVNGDVLRYNPRTGKFLGALIPDTDPKGPFAPRGILVRNNILYVADQQGAVLPNGRIEEYDVRTGKFLGDIEAPRGFTGNFGPRGGIVFGPHDSLYVSVFDLNNPVLGYIVRFELDSRKSEIIASNVTVPDLHRPEGLVFGPNGDLYVASFRADATDTDKILELNPTTGALVSETNLDEVDQPRAFAQDILFGPGGRLFVPITGNGPDTGAVRSYDVSGWSYYNFVPPNADGGPVGSAFYITFQHTNPATLVYQGSSGSGTTAATVAHSSATNTSNADLVWALLGDATTGHHKQWPGG